MRWIGWFRREKNSSVEPQGLLRRLSRDQRGATLAMMAAVVIPMIGMVGGAVDISRAYLVKVRLQQACDAGVLAARRTMTGSSVASDTNAKTQATNFFKINLKNGAYGATVTPIAVSDVLDAANKPTGTVHGDASATVPTTLMKVFGKASLAMTASCEATLQVANNDVMFVLDTTGSMNCAASDTDATCSNNGGVEKSNARIKALRSAVVEFYDTLAAATTASAQLRVGIMPYSANVNVGKLLPAAYIADSAPYQSRVMNFNTPQYNPNTPTTAQVTQVYGSSISQTDCTSYGKNLSFTGFTPTSPVTGGGPAPTATWTKTYANNSATGVDWGYPGATDTSGTTRTCRRTQTTTTTTYSTVYKFTNYSYTQDNYDTSGFKSAAPTIATGTTGTVTTSGTYNPLELVSAPGATGLTTGTAQAWNGCIEERQTVAQATFSPVPANAYDLNIDMLPTTDPTTQWKPSWTEMEWYYYDSSHIYQMSAIPDLAPCPKQAMKLAVTSHDAVYNYVNAADFKAIGNTYHDVGMLWGARFLSPTGIFSAENNSAPNGLPINRSIVFMTDGDMNPSTTTYGLYGFELLDQRVTGGNFSDQENRHNNRFSAICQAIKDMNITIYVVAYAQTMTTQLQNCATPGKSFYAADDAALTSAFQQIARQIAQLRLSR